MPPTQRTAMSDAKTQHDAANGTTVTTKTFSTHETFRDSWDAPPQGMFAKDPFFQGIQNRFTSSVNRQFHQDAKQMLTDELEGSSPDKRAVTMSEDERSHKVTIDVHDFKPENLKVKFVDDNQLVVEGTIDVKVGGQTTQKSFHRSFAFPGLVKPDKVASSMSPEGVLTITIPKKEMAITAPPASSTSSTSTSQHIKSSSNVSSNNLASKTASSNTASNSALQSSDADEATKALANITMLTPESMQHKSFHENFFEKAQEDFRKTMDSLRTPAAAPKTQAVTETKTIVVQTQEPQDFKVSVDLKEMKDGDIRLKVVNDTELVLEATLEKKDGLAVSKSTMCRSFQLPPGVDARNITSKMAVDGTLTITAPALKKK